MPGLPGGGGIKTLLNKTPNYLHNTFSFANSGSDVRLIERKLAIPKPRTDIRVFEENRFNTEVLGYEAHGTLSRTA